MATNLSTTGVACNFAFIGTSGGATISGTGIAGYLFQSGSLTNNAKVEEVMDASGDTSQRGFYDQSQDASIEYVVSGANIAAARTGSTIPVPGAIVTISACADMPGLVQTNWVVEPGVQISGSNTSYKRVTLPLKRHANITAVTVAS